MDEYRENVKKVQKALNQDAAFIQPNPYLAQRVLNAANAESYGKGGITVKRKMPIALIIAIALMLSGLVAVAATLLWQEYAPEVKRMENEFGRYDEWPIDAKASLISNLAAMGYITDQELVDLVVDSSASDEERNSAADMLLLELIGSDSTAEISLNTITYSIMGYKDTWSPAQRVWWQEVKNMFREKQGTDTLVIPDETSISEQQAIEIAKAAIIHAYGLPSTGLDQATAVADLYVTEQRPTVRRWYVRFKLYKDDDSSYVDKQYFCHLSADGEIIEDPDVGAQHLKSRAQNEGESQDREPIPLYKAKYDEYAALVNYDPFWQWPYELKAQCCMEVKPLTCGYEEVLGHQIGNAMYYTYGLPEENHITSTDAYSISVQAMKERYGLTTEQIGCFSSVYYAFDVTNEEQPTWKIIFIDPNAWFGLRYRVHLDARNGEVLLIECFPWKEFRQDTQYDLKYY